MKYTIRELFTILKMRFTEDEICQIAGVREDILQTKMMASNTENDQMAIRIYYRLFCEMYRYELDLLEELHEVNREAFILRLVEQEAVLVSE